MEIFSTANPTWGDIFESSKLKSRTSLLPRFSEKRHSSSSFELWALKQCSKMSPQVGSAVSSIKSWHFQPLIPLFCFFEAQSSSVIKTLSSLSYGCAAASVKSQLRARGFPTMIAKLWMGLEGCALITRRCVSVKGKFVTVTGRVGYQSQKTLKIHDRDERLCPSGKW